jgi:hypothetical protein
MIELNKNKIKISMIKNAKKSDKNLRSFSTPNLPHSHKNLSLLQPHIILQSN